ncbi:MAG: O-antigen ligase family protein, partial [bacterium]|nr:O-antigen ligase family protein [bacterium]
GGGTESAHIRLYVWNGAINAWKNNPLFGTGVETFAFAYFKYKPAGQNLTSEWNFLYNKAHNEYLNYLATTGIFGLGTYLLMIGYFLFLSLKQFKANYTLDAKRYTLVIALLASYISILVTNFFGFSVVITNIYLFLIPAFVFVLTGILPENKSGIENHESRNLYQWTSIFFIILASLFMIQNLFQFWRADIAYALGYNLDRAGEYQSAYPHLKKAVELRRSEPIFKDELSVNNAIIAASLIAQKNQNNQDQTLSVASSLAQEAINLSNKIISQYQNNAVFWKTRVRVFYTLSQVDSRYLPRALDAIEKAALIAPNDANILYNLGVLYGQNSNITKGVEILEKTIQLKPDYRDAHYALGLFYRSQALDSTGKIVVNDLLNKKAIAQMQYILDNLSPNDSGALGSIKTWTL